MLELLYSTQEDIPSEYVELYTEKDGKFHFTGIKNLPTQENVFRLEDALRKERINHKKTKEKFGTIDPDKVQEMEDELADLRVRIEAGEGGDGKKIEELAEKKANIKTAPLEREITKLKETLNVFQSENDTLKKTISGSKVESALRKAAEEAKVVPSAIDDIVSIGSNLFEVTEEGKVIARDNAGTLAGSPPDIWLSDMKDKRQHWWPPSNGGGAGGGKDGGGAGGGNNPWSKGNWNTTEQMKYEKTHGTEKATMMAKQAGSNLGAAFPPDK